MPEWSGLKPEWVGSGCFLGPAFDKEAEVLSTSALEAFFYRLHFLSKRLYNLQHGRLKDPHLLLELDVKLITQGFF